MYEFLDAYDLPKLNPDEVNTQTHKYNKKKKTTKQPNRMETPSWTKYLGGGVGSAWGILGKMFKLSSNVKSCFLKPQCRRKSIQKIFNEFTISILKIDHLLSA